MNGILFELHIPYALIKIFVDSLDWNNAAAEGPTIWDGLSTSCSRYKTKPVIISNKIQFEKFEDKLTNFADFVWLGLRLTSEGTRNIIH